MSERYVSGVSGSALPQVGVVFPDADGSFYTGGTLYINPDDPLDWDVIHHEYGHYVSDRYNLDSNPGGCHNPGKNLSEDVQKCLDASGNVKTYGPYGKDKGTKLAWGEGWPTYFALSLQRARGGASLGIPNVGDRKYTDGGTNIDYSRGPRWDLARAVQVHIIVFAPWFHARPSRRGDPR
jgi:hypothetical protein